MASDARENYRAVFGVYPNEPPKGHAAPTDIPSAGDCTLTLVTAANDLHAKWDKAQFAGISDRAQELLKQIQVATVALRNEVVKPAISGQSS